MVQSQQSSFLGRFKRVSLTVCTAALFFASCSTTLTGRLVSLDMNFKVPTDARVNISRIDAPESEQRSWVLNVKDDGTFSSEGSLPNGNYLVEAIVPGYRMTSLNIQLKESRTVDLKLEPLAKTAVRTIDTRDNQDELNRGQGDVRIVPPQL